MIWKMWPQEKPTEESKECKYLGCTDNAHSRPRELAFFDGSFQKWWGGWNKYNVHYWMKFPEKPPLLSNKKIDVGYYIHITPKLRNLLDDDGIYTIDDLFMTTPDNLLTIKGFGQKRIESIIFDLNHKKIELPEEWKKWTQKKK